MFYSFLDFFNAEVLLVSLGAWGLGVTLYLLKVYLQRQNIYHTRVQDRITRIGNQPLGRIGRTLAERQLAVSPGWGRMCRSARRNRAS